MEKEEILSEEQQEGTGLCSSIRLGDYTYIYTYIAILPFVLRMNDDCIPLRESGSQATMYHIGMGYDISVFVVAQVVATRYLVKDLDMFNFQIAKLLKHKPSSPW